MADLLEQQVLCELRKGREKHNILKKLGTKDNRDDLAWHLNHFPTGRGRKHNQWINWLLVIVLLAVTVNKLYLMARIQLNALAVNRFSPILLLDLIVPAINFFVLSKIIRFHRQGYQFMAVLGILALLQPENQVMPNLAMYIVITGLSIFLLLLLFPKQEQIEG